jgi:hypothetical protein
MPSACDDCECSNWIGAEAIRNGYLAAAQERLVPLQLAAAGGTALVRTFSVPTTWTSAEDAFGPLNNFNIRGLLCFFPTDDAGIVASFTGINLHVYIAVRYDCTAPNNCGAVYRQTLADRTNEITRYVSPFDLNVFRQDTTACAAGSTCSCYNVNSYVACCNGKQYDQTTYKCCGNGLVVFHDEGCPCTSADQCSGTDELSCCLASKYPELNSTENAGTCYNPSVHRCCNTGERYNPGEDQCCSINGVQSLNVPCPCGTDTDCQGGQASATENGFVCCQQVSPVPSEPTFCSIYANFPSGTGGFSVQRCLGQCIDPSYQICCNGNTCVKEYEKCCNQTCCNQFTGACHRANRGNTLGQRFNFANFATNANITEAALVQDICTNIRQMTPIRAFWIFVLPTAFLLATFLALAVALVYANKAAIRVFTWVERFLIFFAVILTLLACPLYFSPLYKYGGVIALICFWVIITAATRVRWINAVAIGALIFLQIYLYDPFHGSAYFNLAYWRVWTDSPHAGMTDYRSNGLIHTTRMMFPNVTTTNQYQWCTRYYDYFLEDPALKDFDRLDNPLRTTFGYCSRGWVMALYLISGFIFIASLLLLVLAIMALINRFRKEILEPVELEVRAVDDIGY